MSLTDPIADLLTRIRNAAKAQHRYLDIRWSKMKVAIAQILKDQGFIESFLVREHEGIKTLRVFLRYKGLKPVICGLKRRSKPGCRKYVSAKQIPVVLGGIGVSIVSTSKGVMTGESARQQNIGGELLCEVW